MQNIFIALLIGIAAGIIEVIILIWPNEKKSAIPILSLSAILGIGVALAGSYFIN